MKVFLTSCALVVLLLMGVIYQSDYQGVELIEEQLKQKTDEAAASASLFYEAEAYGEGFLAFSDQEIKKIQDSLNTSKEQYRIHVFDESGAHRFYDETEMKSETSFSFSYAFTDGLGFMTRIEHPCIVVEGEKQGTFYRLRGLEKRKQEVKRSAMVMVEGR